MERVAQFFSAGIPIAANVHVPDDLQVGERRPAIVLCHGFGGIKDLALPDLARVFVEAGYVVLRFDYRGFGESGGTRFRLIPLEQVEDIRNAITFLSLQPEVDPNRIGIYGTSFGGANAIYATALDSRAKCVVSTVGIGNGERWLRSLRRNWEWIEFRKRVLADRNQRVLTGASEMVDSDDIMISDPESDAWHQEVLQEFPERAYKLPLETADAIFEYKPEDVVHLIAPRPALFITLAEDHLVPNDQSRAMYARAGEPKELVVLEGPMHHDVYTGEPFRQVMGLARGWFERYLPV